MAKRILDDSTSRLRFCKACNKPFPRSIQSEYCVACQENVLFTEVKNYILENDVTELEVAEKFDLPLSRVREWIRDGRIEYRK